jgi:hypothetical protein
MQFPSDGALQEYLKKHPKADPAKHSVKSPGAPPAQAPKPKRAPRKRAPKEPDTGGAEAAPEAKDPGGAPAKTETVTPTASGAGKGKGPIAFQTSSSEISKQYDDSAKSTRADWYKENTLSPVSRIMQSTGASSNAMTESKDWSKTWMKVSTDESVEKFLSALNDPDSFARAQYEATQAVIRSKLEVLQKRGVIDKDGYVTLYRGVKHSQASELRDGRSRGETHDVEAKVRGLSSWSERPQTAMREEYTDSRDAILEQKVHFSRVAVCWHSESAEYDSNNEREWVVIGEESGACKATLHSRETLLKRGNTFGYDDNYERTDD